MPAAPAGASLLQPEPGTPEAAATASFLEWVKSVIDWGQSLADRAEVGRKAC